MSKVRTSSRYTFVSASFWFFLLFFFVWNLIMPAPLPLLSRPYAPLLPSHPHLDVWILIIKHVVSQIRATGSFGSFYEWGEIRRIISKIKFAQILYKYALRTCVVICANRYTPRGQSEPVNVMAALISTPLASFVAVLHLVSPMLWFSSLTTTSMWIRPRSCIKLF